MSGGSQHNPNGRQSQLGSGWSPLQLQMANLLARAPQAHMASDRGVTWHTPTPPPHLYHVPAPSPPDPLQGLLQLQALKSASGNSVFRHTATPPELYRHTPTPPDKHHMRHTPSPGDIKASAALPPVDLYQHLAPSRAEKLRADDLMAYTRVGVDLSLGGGRAANGAATSPAASPAPSAALPRENGDAHAAPDAAELRPASPRPDQPHARRKTRSGSAETIDDIAAMIADTDRAPIAAPAPVAPPSPAAAVTVDKLRSVLASPEAARVDPAPEPEPAPAEAPGEPTEPAAPAAPAAPPAPANEPAPPPAPAAAPRRRSARTSNPEAPNVPVESPSEGKPAEPEASDARTAEPAAVSFVEVENQLEKMFAGLEEEPLGQDADEAPAPAAPARRDRGQKAQRKKADARRPRKGPRDAARDAYDSGSNASSSKSRGPYIQIRGPRDSPLSVSVMNTTTGGEEEDAGGRRKGGEDFRNGVRGVRAVRGLHASTLGLRYDASTPDATWLCAFCQRGPHAASLGDLFGPYTLDNDCDEYRALDEATRRRYSSDEAWFHEACGVWARAPAAPGHTCRARAPPPGACTTPSCARCARGTRRYSSRRSARGTATVCECVGPPDGSW